MSRKERLEVRKFPGKLKDSIGQISRGMSRDFGREVSVAEVVINAINAYVEQFKVEKPEYFRAAIFTRTRDHNLIVEAVSQGCADVEQVCLFVNRARHAPLGEDAVIFLIEDLLGARVLKKVPQGKSGGDAHGNVQKTILVKVGK